MNTKSDREMIVSSANQMPSAGAHARAPINDSPDVLSAVWRYRWAVILPMIAGSVVGFLVYVQTPETYRSTTRLMVESDRPAVLDSMTGDLLGGVPSIDIVRSQLYSDAVVEMAYNSPQLQPFQSQFGSVDAFIGTVQEAMVLEPEVEDVRTAQSLVTLLHYDSPDPELSQAAVQSFSNALQAFFNERQKSSRSDLMQLIDAATERVHPELSKLEQTYTEFRRTAPLAWDSDGAAINPHRERQLFLVQRRSELFEKQRQAAIELAAIESIAKRQSNDLLLGLNIIGQLLGKTFVMPTTETREDMRQGDNQLAQIELDQQLVPLVIERNKYEAEFGPNHPTVKALDAELTTMKNELKQLVEKETSRIVELMTEGRREMVDPAVRARDAVNAVLDASKSQVDLLRQQIAEVDAQIADEKAGATLLAQFEQDNETQLRSIERTRELLDQLEEQMARVKLMDDEGTRVVELTKPSGAYKVAPKMVLCLGLGNFIGLALGAALALLLEKNANTFRDPDEISELLGAPVLTHVPFFKGRVEKSQKGEDDPYEDLDPGLAVIHMPASVAAEAIRSCRTSVFFETAGIEGGKIVQVTSPLPGDGKSTIAGNLACSIAQSGKRVLAIDCDLRRPQLTKNFVLDDALGLTNVLNDDCEAHQACHATPLTHLDVMPSGPIPANPAEALTLPEMHDLLMMLRDEYDFIIIDTPPLLVVTDPSITASMADGVVMALRVRRKSKPNARESVNILRAVGANVLGLVINNSDDVSASDGYRGYGYYRYGRYTSRYYGRGASKNSDKKRKIESSRMTVSGRNARPVREARSVAKASRTTADSRSRSGVGVQEDPSLSHDRDLG